MTDRNIHRVALLALVIAACSSWALAAQHHSVPWSLIAAWLSFALFVETWPRRE